MKNKRIYTPAMIRNSADGFPADQNEFDFVITTDKRDSYGTVFTQDGWDFTRYQQNPVVFYQHRSGGENPDDLIGITVKGPWKETLSDGSLAWIARMQFEPADVNEKAEKIRKKIIAGTIRMASIGADVQQYRWGDKEKGEDPETVFFTRQELYEWSVVNIGSNAGAHVKRSEETIDEIKKEIKVVPINEIKNIGRSAGLHVAKNQVELYKLKSK